MLHSIDMETDTCSLAMGVMLGATATALLLAGYYRQRDARMRMKKLQSERKKTGELIKKAKAEQEAGCATLPGAYLLIALGIATLVLMIILLMGGRM